MFKISVEDLVFWGLIVVANFAVEFSDIHMAIGGVFLPVEVSNGTDSFE